MDEQEPAKPPLPGNNGQFGEDNASEAFERLQNHPPAEKENKGPQQTNAGDRS